MKNLVPPKPANRRIRPRGRLSPLLSFTLAATLLCGGVSFVWGKLDSAKHKQAPQSTTQRLDTAEVALETHAPSSDEMVKALHKSEQAREKRKHVVKSSSVTELTEKLKKDVEPLRLADGSRLPDFKEARGLAHGVRSAVFLAKERGVWETTIKVCESMNMSSDDAFALSYFESGLGREGKNETSSADGFFQFLDDTFIEAFARYGKKAEPLIKEMDPGMHARMQPLIGLVRMASKGDTSKAQYDIAACRAYLGPKNVAKWTDDEVINGKKGVKDLSGIKERILRLRNNPWVKDHASKSVISIQFGLYDFLSKAPKNEYDVACFMRLVHNYGPRGGAMIAQAYKKNPSETMYHLMKRVHGKGFKSEKNLDKFVDTLLCSNGIRLSKTEADRKMTVGEFVGNMEKRWVIARNCFAQWREKMETAEFLNQHLAQMGAPLRVEWNPQGKELFTLAHVSEMQPKRAAVSANVTKQKPANG